MTRIRRSNPSHAPVVAAACLLASSWVAAIAPAASQTTPPSGFQVQAPPQGSGTGETGMRWDVPKDWVAERPSSAMRRAQYRVPGEEGSPDAELVVFYFGPGQGGDANANAKRWAGQFKAPDGQPTEDVETKKIEVGGLPVLRVEVRGTYGGGMRMGRPSTETYPGYMLLGAIVEGPDANWFFKLTGAEATVTAQEKAFDELLQSLTSDGA